MANANKYATILELKATYSKTLLIRVSNFNTEDDFTDYQDDNLTNAVQDASDRMDGYLMERYDTPLSPAPDFFKVDCMTIAVMLLIERKGWLPDTPDESMYNAGRDLLRMKYMKISEGKITIAIPDLSGSAEAVKNLRATVPKTKFTQTLLDQY